MNARFGWLRFAAVIGIISAGLSIAKPASAEHGFAIGGGLNMNFPGMDIPDLPGSIIGLNVLPGYYVRMDNMALILNVDANISYLKVQAGEESVGGLGFGYGSNLDLLYGSSWGLYFSPQFVRWSLSTEERDFTLNEFFARLGFGYHSDKIIFKGSLFRIGARPQAESMMQIHIDLSVGYLF